MTFSLYICTVAVIAFSQALYNFTERSLPFEVCLVVLNNVSIGINLSLSLQTEGITATAGVDFESTANEVTSLNGPMCFAVEILPDDILEDNESFSISIGNLDPRLQTSDISLTIINIIDNNSKS